MIIINLNQYKIDERFLHLTNIEWNVFRSSKMFTEWSGNKEKTLKKTPQHISQGLKFGFHVIFINQPRI